MSTSSRKKRKHEDERLEAEVESEDTAILAASDHARVEDPATAHASGATTSTTTTATAAVAATAAASTAITVARIVPAEVENAAVSVAAPADEDEEDIASDIATVAASDEYTAAGIMNDVGVIAEPASSNAAVEAVRHTAAATAAASATAVPIQDNDE